MSDIDKVQRYVIGKFLNNENTEKITLINHKCFDGHYAELFKQIKKQYIQNSTVDIASLDYDFSELVELISENMMFSFSVESCIDKLNAHRNDKANKYIGTKLINGEISEHEAIDLLNKKMELSEEEVSDGLEVAAETYQKIVERFEKKNVLKTGLNRLDGIIGDLSETGFFVLGGRPSSGKTALTLNITEAVAKQNQKVLFFSLEMSKHKIMQRMILSNAMVDNEKVKNRTLDQREFKLLFESCNKDFLKNIHIIDKSGMSIDEIITKAVALHRKHKYALIVIDYLQLVHAEGSSIREKMINVSHGCVSLRKLLDIPIMVVSSLSRANQARSDKRPIMSDLAEAGAIEFDADTIGFVHREFIENNEHDPCDAEIIFRKQRDGNLGIARQYFRGEHFRFSNWQQEPK